MLVDNNSKMIPSNYTYRGRGGSRVLYLRGAWAAWHDGLIKEYSPTIRHQRRNAALVIHYRRCLSSGAYATRTFRSDRYYGMIGRGGDDNPISHTMQRIARQHWREYIQGRLAHVKYRAGLEIFPQPDLRFAIVREARHRLRTGCPC